MGRVAPFPRSLGWPPSYMMPHHGIVLAFRETPTGVQSGIAPVGVRGEEEVEPEEHEGDPDPCQAAAEAAAHAFGQFLRQMMRAPPCGCATGGAGAESAALEIVPAGGTMPSPQAEVPKPLAATGAEVFPLPVADLVGADGYLWWCWWKAGGLDVPRADAAAVARAVHRRRLSPLRWAWVVWLPCGGTSPHRKVVRLKPAPWHLCSSLGNELGPQSPRPRAG